MATKTLEEYNVELNKLAGEVLKEQLIIGDLREQLAVRNNSLSRLIQKAQKTHSSFNELLTANPKERARFLEAMGKAQPAPEASTNPFSDEAKQEQVSTESEGPSAPEVNAPTEPSPS